jgi:glycerol-3-phosphate dehydrogenase (NAD(P)+)
MKISILGGGSWGTAAAIHLAKNHPQVTLYVRDEAQAKNMRETHENSRYLPGITLPKNLVIESSLQAALKDCTTPIIAVPSHAFSKLLEDICKYHRPTSIAWLTKGLEPKNNNFLHKVLHETVKDTIPFAIISGPSFAKELAKGLPTAIIIASNQEDYAKSLQALFHMPPLRAYLSEDYIGVQIAATVKNVLAIATGISDGLQFGSNAVAALITRGLQEMAKLGLALGAEQETFYGLAGLGDLVLTCTDDQSRNRRFGLYLGQGLSPTEAFEKIGQVVEGTHNCKLVIQLAKQHKLELPIIEMVDKVLENEVNCADAVQSLLTRPAKVQE